MTILGIETSTAVCSVGLADECGLQSERSLVESHIHSEKLLTLIQELCDEQKMKLSRLDGVAVSIGPGSFTGLRIGLSTAKGLCFALEKPLIAVPTFASIAHSVAGSHPDCARVIVCIDAKQREYYIGVYKHDNGTICEVLPVHIGSIASAIAAASVRTLIVTDRTDEVRTESRDSILVQDVFPYCRGDVIAHRALERWAPEESSVWAQREPMYLKDFVVRTQMKLAK
ncbi:MAG: tRNA (adenosine(37)-N6)-threonylcarbamoyltransferase complex dimerization subunit type 1 TsaB [Ignavibacteriales bacterium]|nr:tRNA (adenosine(37)-N6)-threonylcarbamoyltransferase complex dimerization subunit type 1 TsaB [Ignavibacteriales bacterium]